MSSVGQSKPPDPLELQVQEQRFTDDVISRTAQALDDYADRVGTEAARLEALKLKVVFGSTLISIASGPNPNANLIDLVFGAWLTRKTIEDYWMQTPNGPAFQPWLETSRRLETNAWQLAAGVLSPAQMNELRDAIRQWYAQNPEVRLGFFARPQDFAAMIRIRQSERAGANSVFNLVGLDPTSGLTPPCARLPAPASSPSVPCSPCSACPSCCGCRPSCWPMKWRAARGGTGTHQHHPAQRKRGPHQPRGGNVSQTDQLPDRITAERKAILAALDQQEGKLRDLASEVNRSLVSAGKMSASLNTTITTFDGLMKRFGVGEPDTNRSRTPTLRLSTFSTTARSPST